MNPPWHLWLIGVAALLWGTGGLVDFTMTQLGVGWYVSYFTLDQRDYFAGFPVWMNVTWGVAAIGAFYGPVLLLMRSGLAVVVFACSFLAMLISLIYSFVLSKVSMLDLMGQGALIFMLAVALVALLLVLYSRSMRQRAILG